MMRVDIDEGRAFFAPSPDGSTAVHVGVESRMAGTSSAPSHAADLEHSYYFTGGAGGAAAAGGMTGDDTRLTTPRNASSMETSCAASVDPMDRSYCTFA